jgi:short-subunit dehydrogenase
MKALITGASEGIGRALAIQLDQEGYTITAVARNESRLKDLLSQLSKKDHTFLVADLSEPSDMTKIETELKTGKYQLLVNNAGYGTYGKFYLHQPEELLKMMHLNCDALVRLSHAFLQKAKSGDALVNVSSTLAFLPMPSNGLYAATKALVTSFTESLWYEQAPRGIYVMNLCPGVTSTQFHSRAGGNEKAKPPEAITQTPEEVARVAIRALKSRKSPTVISGSKNRLFAGMARVLSRSAVIKMMGKARAAE